MSQKSRHVLSFEEWSATSTRHRRTSNNVHNCKALRDSQSEITDQKATANTETSKNGMIYAGKLQTTQKAATSSSCVGDSLC